MGRKSYGWQTNMFSPEEMRDRWGRRGSNRAARPRNDASATKATDESSDMLPAIEAPREGK
jgi:hypothetical protein